MLRGRIMSANGIKADDIKRSERRLVLQSGPRITFATEVAALRFNRGRGDWWNANYNGPPLVSFEEENCRRVGLKIGDPARDQFVACRNIDARIANCRRPMGNLGHQFRAGVLAERFTGAPHTDIATLTYPGAAHWRRKPRC